MSKLCQINRVKDCFNNDTLKLIIESLVLSKLYYCSTAWANTSDLNLKKLQLVQKFAARIITGARKFDHITPYLQQLGWLPVKDHIRYRGLIVMFKCTMAWLQNISVKTFPPVPVFIQYRSQGLPGGKRFLIIKMRAQHITFSKAIKAISVRF